MSSTCSECGRHIAWDDSVGSAVCTSCGTLTDPSQSVLTSQYDFSDRPNMPSSSWDPGTVQTRILRPVASYAMADQSKEARDERNSLTTFGFIKSLARSLNASGLSPRAMALFHQAKAVTHFRWGRKAKLVAGACLAIALRESNRPDCLHDIAYLLEESLPPLSRTYTSIIQDLHLVLSHVESSSYFPALEHHLSSLVQGQSTALPVVLVKVLNPGSLHSASNTACSLSRLLSRIGPPSLTKYSPSVIACAVYMLSLESEIRTTIKPLAQLARVLAARLHVGKGVMMTCYKAVQDVLASLAENIPWLDKYEKKEGRAKLAKRVIVARATRDIVSFYDDSWRGSEKPVFNIPIEGEVQPQCQDEFGGNSAEDCVHPARKKQKTQHFNDHAIRFLLDPLVVPVSIPCRSPTQSSLEGTIPTRNSINEKIQHTLSCYFLSTQATSHQPTRLQLLAAVRGGADEVSDSELFEEGELEDMMRTGEEMAVVTRLCDWSRQGESVTEDEVSQLRSEIRSSVLTRQSVPLVKGKRSRIDLEALAKFLDEGDDSGAHAEPPLAGLLDTGFEDSSTNSEGSKADNTIAEETKNLGYCHSRQLCGGQNDEVIISDWRPASPGSNGFSDD